MTGKEFGRLSKRIGILVISAVIAAVAVKAIDQVHDNYLLGQQEPQEVSEEADTNTQAAQTTVSTTEPSSEYRDLMPAEGQDLNSFSSGRLFIWQTYAEGFNFIGNPAGR